MTVIPLRDERMAVVCQPNHPLACQSIVHIRKLAHYPMLTFETELQVGRHLRRYFREHGVTPIIDNVFDNIDTIKSAVAQTDRVSILPRRSVLREVSAGTLAAIELEPGLVRPLGIILARRRTSGDASTTQAFVDCLVEHAGPTGDSPASSPRAPMATFRV